MTLPPDDHDLARDLAHRAGEVLVALRSRLVGEGASPWEVMDSGDMAAHHFLVGELARFRPDDAILSEEGRDGPARLTAARVWVVDPLDGTLQYGEPGRPDWAVHVALVVAGVPVAGAVSLPAMGIVLSTGVACGW